MINYKLFNNIIGWLTFVVAMVVYTLTVEPSVPLWDCGEFISASYSLQVVHPPGAPLFLLIGRIFSMFAMGDLANVALAVNMLSVVASALTVAFTFWIITHFALKTLSISINKPEINVGQALAVFGSGLVGALALTFMDTFWFSAVEAEVYASSSLFTALSFWGILKWETNKDELQADRWIVFIAFTIGLAIGLHLLNLLVVPAVVLYYFFIRFEVNRKNTIYALLVGGGSLVFLNWMLIPGVPKLAAFMDKMFVNGFGLPFGSGMVFTMILLAVGLYFAIQHSVKKVKPLLNLGLLCLTYVLIGYSTYTMVVIRSLADPPIDMNNPEDAYSLLSYIQREQYGERALFKGPYYNARPTDYKEGSKTYRKGEEEYEETGNRLKYVWREQDQTMFPRMGDLTEKNTGYRLWYREKRNSEGEIKTPEFSQNIGFMMRYQLGWMYWRYFFWNFAGRQSDIQNVDNNPFEGNWLSGISMVDNPRLGPQENIPDSLTQNKARNKYYMLPFMLGMLGLFFQFKRQQYDATVVTALFVFTGMLIVVYLNQPPLEPRERDYTNVGSYQTFCIWIGLGVLQIATWLNKKMSLSIASVIAIVIGLFAAPVLMANQNWDDHDRSDRYLGLSFAKNYLNSCEQNAILFTNGDNDTYPLWYAQNVQGIRTDVRVINLSLLSTEWYADALTRKYYDSEPMPLSIIPKEKLKDGQRDMLSFFDKNPRFKEGEYYLLKDVLKHMTSDDKRDMASRGGELENYIGARNVLIPINKEQVISKGLVQEKDSADIVKYIQFTLGTRLMKGSIVMLDIISTNAERGWERPIYFTTTTGDDTYANLESYFRHEGLTYQLVPLKNEWKYERGMIDDDLLYKRLMTDFVWGNMDKGTLYLDHKATLVPKNLRVLFVQLARNFMLKGDTEKAKALTDESLRVIPHSVLPIETSMLNFYADIYLQFGEKEKSLEILNQSAKAITEQTDYFLKGLRKGDKDIRAQFRAKLIGYRGDGKDCLYEEANEAKKIAERLEAKELAEQLEGVAKKIPI
jgi:Protein O-mannosyl-transferase TMEM260-like